MRDGQETPADTASQLPQASVSEIAAATAALARLHHSAIAAAAAEAGLRTGFREILVSLGRRNQSLLLVVDTMDRWVGSFQIQPDGSLADGEPFYRLEISDDAPRAGGDGMTLDSEGYLYVATRTGIQVCDQPGRVVAIINKPQPKGISNVVFGGPELDWLFVTATDKVYRRHLRRKGVVSWAPVKPPQPRL